MTQKILFIVSLIMCFVVAITFITESSNNSRSLTYDLKTNSIDNMPLVNNDPFSEYAYGGSPTEQRGIEYRKWMSAGLKIMVSDGSGSGTIVYYDEKDGWAYIQSCGHLWTGNMTAEEGRIRKITCKVETWYHNEKKLRTTRVYPAEVIYFSNSQGRDISLMRFKPDWVPNYFPIAPEGYRLNSNQRLHSVGCDGGHEIAHYDVRVVGIRGGNWPDLVTTENSPRPGRSGGGLLSEDFYVAVCWGTSSYDGGGNGYFTPLKTVHQYNKMNGYGWLNEVSYNLARMMPIVDRNNPQGEYPNNYIPLPTR